MTHEQAVIRATEAMAANGFVDLGRGCLERRGAGQKFHSATLIKGQAFGERIGDPYWQVEYEAMIIEDDGSMWPTLREQTGVIVDDVTGEAVTWHTL